MATWRTTGTRAVYANPWISVREDEVVRPDGGTGIYGVVTLAPAVFVVPLDDDDRVVLVEVDRYTVGRSLEVPAGGSDGQPPLDAAVRELREETGLAATDWVQVGGLDALNGIAQAPEHVFLARGLTSVADPADEQRAEGITGLQRVPFAQVWAMVAAGRIRDGETVAALALVAAHLGRVR